MTSIHLKNCAFYSYHGLHEEEAMTGGKFLVDATVSFDENGYIDSISKTIDYVMVYDVIRSYMNKRYPLLETLAMDIATAIHNADKKIKNINISIQKINPPLPNFIGNLGITFSKDFY